ncbi:hypothetical protein ONE63_001338 [Megalurothrips usitatus]|uniref:LITAF domain-containing protein n=1 Tax=Megalurothrips usitatus TaxID=439358 RepID=A0AAV7XBV7_9NEOP|nr:hypothetical protein ONE63_001338 [Megalurothrips usitatus]
MQQASAASYPPQMPVGPGSYTGHPQPMPMMPMPQPMPQPVPYASPQVPSQPPAPPAPGKVLGFPPLPLCSTLFGATTIIFTSLGRDRTVTACPKCHAQIMTETREENKCLAHIFCCILMFTDRFPCCCCLPYCMDSCKIVKHRCPNCRANIGVYRG